jgi:hypothetical protein
MMEDNIKMDLKEAGCDYVDGIQMAEHSAQRSILVKCNEP